MNQRKQFWRIPLFLNISRPNDLKLLVSQSKFSGTRKLTLRYQSFKINFDFEISQADFNGFRSNVGTLKKC